MTTAAACRTCGTEPCEGARFCDACGSLIAPATAPHLDHRLAPVLNQNGVALVYNRKARDGHSGNQPDTGR